MINLIEKYWYFLDTKYFSFIIAFNIFLIWLQ